MNVTVELSLHGLPASRPTSFNTPDGFCAPSCVAFSSRAPLAGRRSLREMVIPGRDLQHRVTRSAVGYQLGHGSSRCGPVRQ
jgi:hypothetical protein